MREMCQTFGITALSETVEVWMLKNEFLTAEVLTYGAALRRLVFGGVDVVLGYDTLCSLTNHSYFNLNGSGVYSAVLGHGGHLPAVVLLHEGAVAPQKASSDRR